MAHRLRRRRHDDRLYPVRYEKSIGTDRTAELAVMCDTFKPLWLTTVADDIEEKDYHTAWVQTESAVHK